jgi:hypothetical protein
MGSLNRKRYEDAKLLRVVLKAVAKQCLECAGGTVLERKFCQCECDLWPYRFGRIKVDPALIDRKNFAEGAVFGFDKEAVKCEASFRKSEKRRSREDQNALFTQSVNEFPL